MFNFVYSIKTLAYLLSNIIAGCYLSSEASSAGVTSAV
jgi:hypothetical protein